MEAIKKELVQEKLNQFKNQEAYIHMETTNGAYASHRHKLPNVGVFVRNAKVGIQEAKVTGEGPYRVGVKIELGWLYAEGLTSYEILNENQLLLYGFDAQGKLAVALQLSPTPFGEGLS